MCVYVVVLRSDSLVRLLGSRRTRVIPMTVRPSARSDSPGVKRTEVVSESIEEDRVRRSLI